MLIRVYVTPNAGEASVVKVSEDFLEVKVDDRALDGRANKRLLEILAEHFKIPKSRISIVRGTKSRNKFVQVILERTADSTVFQPSQKIEWRAKRRKRPTNGQNQDSPSSRFLTR